MHARHLVIGAMFAGTAAVIACNEPSAPASPKSPGAEAMAVAPRNDGNGGGNRVHVIKWIDTLTHDVVRWRKIGPRGGVIYMRPLHASFTVPAGALTSNTVITVRAITGRRVVFQMQPEGLQFLVPATLSMPLDNTNAFHNNGWRNMLVGGYITSAGSITPDDSVTDYEDHPALTDSGLTMVSWPVPHFSVVILASQRTTHTNNRPQ